MVIVIHEIFGSAMGSRWPTSSREDGFIAVAPESAIGNGPNGGGTDELGDKATQVIRNLTPQDTMARLDAVRAYAIKLPSANGKSAVDRDSAGEASTSFDYAIAQPGLSAAVRLLRHVAVGPCGVHEHQGGGPWPLRRQRQPRHVDRADARKRR